MMHRIGVDFGGTKIEGIVLDAAGHEIFRKRIETRQEKGYDFLLLQIRDLYQDLTKPIPGKPHTLGIGTPGALSRKSGLLKNSNTVCMNGKPVRADLERILGREFTMENDANCFAMAESLFGAGRGKDLVFGVIMGTGCGGGIVYQGKVWTGLQAIGGEWGHMSIDPQGPECYCGMRGCVETLISGGGLERMFEEEVRREVPFTSSRYSLKEIVTCYRAGDPAAMKLMGKFFENFGRAMANLINILDPDIVVLGGGVSNIDELYSLGIEEVRRRVFSDSLETPIVKHQLGDSAGVLGAALIGK